MYWFAVLLYQLHVAFSFVRLPLSMEATCDFGSNEDKLSISCISALFNDDRHIKVRLDKLYAVKTNDFCCDAENLKKILPNVKDPFAVLCDRGECGFQQKAEIINLLALEFPNQVKALVIVNSETGGPAFAASSVQHYSSNVPSFMISNDAAKRVFAYSNFTQLNILYNSKFTENWVFRDLSLGFLENKTRITNEIIERNTVYSNIFVQIGHWMLYVGIIVCCMSEMFPFISDSLGAITINIAILLLFVFMRASTFHLSQMSTMTPENMSRWDRQPVSHLGTDSIGSLLFPYNHHETDEYIFEILVQKCLLYACDISQYYLGSDIIDYLHIARVNYLFDVFIHPPVFVIVSSVLVKWGDVPLVMVPLILQFVTALCMLRIMKLWRFSDIEVNYSLILFAICPLAAFCATKFWIDNCLCASVSIGVWIVVEVMERLERTVSFMELSRHCVWIFVSGLLFSVVAMNTKVTGIACVPALIFYVMTFDSGKAGLWSILLTSVSIIAGIVLACGVVAGYTPWLLYYKSIAGVYLPNAWPSKEMIDKSAFMKKVVLERQWYYYLQFLGSVVPVYGFGLLRCVLTCGKSLLNNTAAATMRIEITLGLWAVGFIFGHSLLGALGAGFQTRFILPAVPSLCMLAGRACNTVNKSTLALVILLIVIGAVHAFNYGVLFSGVYADIDGSVFDAIGVILRYPAADSTFPSAVDGINSYMRRFGIYR